MDTTSVLLQLKVHVMGWVVNLMIDANHFAIYVNWQ